MEGPQSGNRRSRRSFLLAIGTVGVGLAAAAFGGTSGQAAPETAGPPPHANLGRGREHIVQENRRAGSARWDTPQLRQSRPKPPPVDKSSGSAEEELASSSASDPDDDEDDIVLGAMAFVDTPIRGYAGQTSINRGQAINLHISTSRPSYTLEVYRMGWYGGVGARLMATAGPLVGQNQSVPAPNSTTGLLALNWSVSYRLQTGNDWVTGFYLVKLISSAGEESHIPFVLRDDGLAVDVLYQIPVTTYQAYNEWGGKSLYEYNSTRGRRAYKVSFDRPYAHWAGAGDFFEGDYNMVRWIESQGYSVAYATSLDVHSNPSLMSNHGMLLSNWHDEYWSLAMRNNVTTARDQGKHLVFLDSNNVYWQVRFENSASGVANRIMTCYKSATLDPNPNPSLKTVTWRENPVNRPENALLGVMFNGQFQYGTSYPWVVQNANHWLYAGTGLANGQTIPGLVGYEYDSIFNNGQTPANLTVLAASPVAGGRIHNASIYTTASGSNVFTAGTNYWPWKLDDNPYQQRGVDTRVRQMTANLFNQLGGGPPPTPQPSTPPPAGPPYRDTILADTPISYWRLGETSGTTAGDERGLHPGTYQNGPVLGQPGAVTNDPNPAVQVDGVNDFVQVPYAAALNPTSFSVEVWAYPTGGAGTYRGLIASRAYPRGWIIYATSGNVWSFWLNSGTGMVSIDGLSVTLNAWTHLVATFDGTTARLYMNGAAVASGTLANFGPNTTAPLTIGQGEVGSNFWFSGRIDEVSVYPVALSPSKVQAHYTAGLTGSAPSGAAALAAAAAPAAPTPTPTTTQGLRGQYFSALTPGNLVLTRVDDTVNFAWDSGTPLAGVAENRLSVLWTGQVQAVFSETYTFAALANDGIRLWVNGQLLVDRWTESATAHESSGQITLVAGQWYDIQLEYSGDSSAAQVRLSWSSPRQPKQIVPANRLRVPQ